MTRMLREWLLSRAQVYELFQSAIGANGFRRWIIETLADLHEGHSILDIGCGPASFYPFVRTKCREYVGYETHMGYVTYARRRYGHENKFTIFGQGFNDDCIANNRDRYDRILLMGLLHHLTDSDSRRMLAGLKAVLKPEGFILTMDPCRTESAGIAEKWIMARDRGEFIRTPTQYHALAFGIFPRVDQVVKGGLARIPTHANFLRLYNADLAGVVNST